MSATEPPIVSQGGANPESPWLGLRSFSEETQEYFFGRTAELQDLLERVVHKPLTVLFGQSGLGKTSLIQAGLIPKLRDERLLPVRIRLRYGTDAPPPGRQMLESLHDELIGTGQDDLARACFEASDLWLLLHDRSAGFIKADGSALVRPVFLFDQFEEIFTLGEAERATAENFRETLAAIVENRMPAEVRKKIEESDNLADQVDYHARPAKVLISLREDFLHLVERWRHQLPALMDNRMELRPLSGTQALEVVTEPGRLRPGRPPIVSEKVAAGIVRFVAGVRSDVPLEEIDAVPPLLSLMCAELNAQRLEAHEETISSEQLEGQSSQILERFYSETFANHPGAVREFVEDRLLSDAGYRQAVTLDTAEAELVRGGLADETARTAVADLVQRRLLTVEERGGVRRIELTHDVLAPVATASRLQRREREANALQARRQQERLRRQRRRAFLIGAALLLICLGLLAYAWRSRQQINYRQLIDEGTFSLENIDYENALSKFKEAVRIDGSDADAWFGIGDALVRQAYSSGDARHTTFLQQAIDAYGKAVELAKKKSVTAGEFYAGKSKLAQAYVGLGDTYAVGATPDVAKATELYRQAAAIDSGLPDPHVGYGNIHLDQGEFHLALGEYKKALAAAKERNTTCYGAHAGLGATWLALGQYAYAIQECDRAIGASPQATVARFRLATAIYLQNKDEPRAADLFKSFVGSPMARVDSLGRTSLAYILLEKSATPSGDDLAKAIGLLEEAHQRDPYAFSAFRLGIGRALEGNVEKTSQLWEEATKLSWGDSLSTRTYAPLLRALRNDPAGLDQFRQIVQQLAGEGAAGTLENIRRDAELVRRSSRFNTQVEPVMTALDEGIAKAREQNKPEPSD